MTEVIKEIIGKHVAIEEDLNSYLKKQGVIVRVSFGGGRNTYSVNKSIYGIEDDKLSTDSKEFWKEHVSDGTLWLLPKTKAAKFRAVESRVKKRLKEISIGYGNSFVPIQAFSEFKEYFDENQKEYFELRDEAVGNYDGMVERFLSIAKGALKGLSAGEEELDRIHSRLPSKEKFQSSFRMEMSVTAFPTMENLDMFDDEIKENIKVGIGKDEEDLLRESVVKTMNEALSTLSSVIKSCADNGKIHSRVALGVKNGVRRMAQSNIAGNEKLEKFREEIASILTQNPDEASNTSEFILAKIYSYAKDLGIEGNLDLNALSYSVDGLEDLVSMYL